MSLNLQQHQQEAYDNLKQKFENGRYGVIIFPTGAGKSFVAMKLLEENKDKRVLFLSPYKSINRQFQDYIKKYMQENKEKEWREILPNLKMHLYQSLLNRSDETLKKLKPDIIILDEMHRVGAEKWGERVQSLLKLYPNAKVLGMTATPDRNDKDNRNMANEIAKVLGIVSENEKINEETLDKYIASEITLVEAIQRNIIKPHKYVPALYTLKDDVEDIKTKILECPDPKKKAILLEKYKKMRSIVDRAEGLSEIFEKNIEKKDGRYIVFCKDQQHLEQMAEEAKEWFKNIDSQPEIYKIHANYGEKHNHGKIDSEGKIIEDGEIRKFERSNSNHIKLLFTVNMINEGVHIEGVSGVIMLRKTESRLIYLQQLGRALSTRENKQEIVTVYDIANNYLKYNLDREVNDREHINRTRKNESKGKKNIEHEEMEIDTFKITGEIKELLDLLNETQGMLKPTKAQEYLRIFSVLKQNGIDIRKIKRLQTIAEIIQPGIDIQKIIDENYLEGNMHIGLAKQYIERGIEGKENGLKMTKEEKEEFLKLGIMEKLSLARERIEVLQILKQNGVEIDKISVYDTIGTINQEGVNIEEIIKKNNLDSSMRIGDIISKIKLGMKSNPSGLRMTEEEKEEFLNLGIDPDKTVQRIRVHEYLRIFTVLQESGIDIDKMQWNQTLEDYTQEGIDVKKIIEANSIDGRIKPKQQKSKIIKAMKKGSRKFGMTEEEKEEFIKIGIFPTEKSRAQEYIEIFTILKANGVDLEQLRMMERYSPLKQYEQDGIDIDKIIKENKLDGEIKIVDAMRRIKLKSLQMTDKEMKAFEKLGIIREEKSIIDENLKLLTILKECGVDLGKIRSTVRKLSDINQEDINIQEIIDLNELDGETKIGSMLFRIKATLKGTTSHPLKMTEKQKEAFFSLGLFDEEKTKAQEHIELLSLLADEGIDIRRMKTKDKLKDITQSGVDIQNIIQKYNLDENLYIGNILGNLRRGIAGKKNGTLMTEEEKQKVIELGILDRVTKAEEYIELFTILKNNGVKIAQISNHGESRLKDIKQEGIDIQKVIEDHNLDGELRIGQIKVGIRRSIEGEKPQFKMTEEQKKEFIKLGIMDDRETKAQEYLKIFRILKENKIDFSNIRYADRLEDIEQEGIDIQQIIEENDLNKEIKIGDLKYRIIAGIEGKKNGIDVSELKEEFIALGIMDKRKTSAQQYLEIFTTLKQNGVRIEDITTTTNTLEDIEQEGIDIEKIIQENHLNRNMKIGGIIMRLRQGIRNTGSKNSIKLTSEERKKFIELGIYQPTRLEELETQKRALEEKLQQVKEKKNKSKKLREQYQLELDKQKGIGIE